MNGFQIKINFGNKVNAANRATSMANAVNTPKYIVGIKFDSTSMENPMMMVMAL